MPAKSKAQAKLMYAVTGSKRLGKKIGIPTQVAEEFVRETKSLKNLPTKVKKK